jgi:hypothetical protein
MPGRAEKKNPAIGNKINSNGVRINLKREKLFGLLGLCILSITIIMTRKTSEIVRIKDESLGTV